MKSGGINVLSQVRWADELTSVLSPQGGGKTASQSK